MLEEQRANNTPGRPNTSRRHLLWISGVWVLPLCWLLGWIRPNTSRRHLLWISGVWVLPLCWLLGWIFPSSVPHTSLVLLAACSLAPLPALLISRRRRHRALSQAANAREEAEQLKLQLENVRLDRKSVV